MVYYNYLPGSSAAVRARAVMEARKATKTREEHEDPDYDVGEKVRGGGANRILPLGRVRGAACSARCSAPRKAAGSRCPAMRTPGWAAKPGERRSKGVEGGRLA